MKKCLETKSKTRKKTKIRNGLPKIIPSGEFLGALLGKLAEPLVKVSVPLAKIFLARLATKASASAVDGAIQGKMRRRIL